MKIGIEDKKIWESREEAVRARTRVASICRKWMQEIFSKKK